MHAEEVNRHSTLLAINSFFLVLGVVVELVRGTSRTAIQYNIYTTDDHALVFCTVV